MIMKWARHHKTGQPPSLELVDQALSQHKHFSGIEIQTQLLYAAVDQVRYLSALASHELWTEFVQFRFATRH